MKNTIVESYNNAYHKLRDKQEMRRGGWCPYYQGYDEMLYIIKKERHSIPTHQVNTKDRYIVQFFNMVLNEYGLDRGIYTQGYLNCLSEFMTAFSYS